MVVPPGVPSTMLSLLSLLRTRVGVILLSGRLPGAMAFAFPPMAPYKLGVPGFALKSSIWLLRIKPAPGITVRLP